jgi:hypothetical protein
MTDTQCAAPSATRCEVRIGALTHQEQARG